MVLHDNKDIITEVQGLDIGLAIPEENVANQNARLDVLDADLFHAVLQGSFSLFRVHRTPSSDLRIICKALRQSALSSPKAPLRPAYPRRTHRAALPSIPNKTGCDTEPATMFCLSVGL